MKKHKVKAWAVIDCAWKTIREIQFKKKLLRKQDCKDCKVVPVEIIVKEKSR